MHINDYVQNIYHSVKLLPQEPLMKYDPQAANKYHNVRNIEYDDTSNDTSKNRQFKINPLSDLGLHGNPVTASHSIVDLRALLLKQLQLRYRIQRYKDA